LNINWQDFVSLGLVGTAVAYIARSAWRHLFDPTRAPGCGTGACAACPSRRARTTGANGGVPQQIVTIDAIPPPNHGPREPSVDRGLAKSSAAFL
jgi:hypothetical protein